MNLLFVTFFVWISFSYGYNWAPHKLSQQHKGRVVYQWNQLEFGFPNDHSRKEAEATGNLKPANAIPIDVQPHYNDKGLSRTFVTIPRFQEGIPYSLATVSNKNSANGPLLEPYPNYEMHNNNNGLNCNAITSAFRVAITECNQMWVIDSGSVGSNSLCPPQLLMFDLNTNEIKQRYRFNTSLYTPGASLFINPVVNVKDSSDNCRNTMVYIADVNYHGLVVYDSKQETAWRIENRFMYPDPRSGVLTVAGESFTMMDGIFGMATDKKNLYFHPLSSTIEYSVPLAVIDNATNSENIHKNFIPLGTRGSECAASAMDSNNNLYCVTLNPIELIKWNVNSPYNKRNIQNLNVNPEILQFVSGIKVVRNNNGMEELWLISNRFQKMAAGTQNFNEVNFRIVLVPLQSFGKSDVGYADKFTYSSAKSGEHWHDYHNSYWY